MPIAALLLGAMSVFGFAPFGWWGVPLLTLVGLFALWRRAPAHSAMLGWAFGLGYFGAGVSWIYISLHTFGEMPASLAALAVLLFAAFLALFPAVVGYIHQRSPSSAIWSVPASWILMEWVRGWIFTGFPWLAVGYSQVPVSPLAGYAPIIGVFGISLLLAWTAAALVWRSRYSWLIIVLWAGAWLMHDVRWTQPVGAPLSVSLVQGNISQSVKWQPEQVWTTLQSYRDLAQQSTARLIVLPETALPLFFDQIPVDYLADLASHARQNGGDILFGVPERLSNGHYYNSVMNVGTAATQVYRKSHLVPFGEYIPMKPVFGVITEVLHIPLSDFSRGDLYQPAFQIAGQQVAADVCYEDVFGEEIIRALPQATLLVNVTNDAWFGDSIAPWQHLQIAQMRALESGRQMLRATNTGATAIIDVDGVVLKQLPLFTRATLTTQAQGYQGLTPFARFANYPALILAGLMLLVALWRIMKHPQSI
ncbi:MAG: apolipoprotein N-acyltransferase [Sulfuriferula sp.]|nr:apolipoprotein N-acyltransferase [Sulfuriferula sp.]